MGPGTQTLEGSTLPALDGSTVLVVDDGEANVLLLKRLLSRAGARHVEGITDPRRAVERFHAISPDIVLLDMHMPWMDGLEVLEALQTAIPAGSLVPIVILTADTTVEARHKALAAGAKDFITKPFEQTEVLLRIQNLLETRSLHMAVQRHNAELEADLRRRTEVERRTEHERSERAARIDYVLSTQAIKMVYQPIIHLCSDQMQGVEALARFSVDPVRGPDEWFTEAATIGKGADLELLAIRLALQEINSLPDCVYLSVNLDPDTIFDERLATYIGALGSRIVVELTEHSAVDEYDRLAQAMEPLRQSGVRFAVDDAGSGYSSLRHILRLRPDIIKLDRDLTCDLDTDPARRALASALVRFAQELGSEVTAEGIETEQQLTVLRQLGVDAGQGYLLGRPAPLT